MLAFTLNATAVKDFMGRLLREAQFDFFCVRTVELTLNTHISISGKLENQDKPQTFVTWGELRPLVHDLIKRGIKPKLIKIIFSHPSPTDIHTNAAALFLNMTYEKDGVNFTTATAQREFVLEKSLDNTWDEWMRAFCKTNIGVVDNE